MTDSKKPTNEKHKKLSDEEIQAWLDSVHFGSCCSDPITSSDTTKDNTCRATSKDKK